MLCSKALNVPTIEKQMAVAFGATVLVPLLIGINPATALFTAGVGREEGEE